jgi:two-component system heavy metal sensor histidine kinase CusS
VQVTRNAQATRDEPAASIPGASGGRPLSLAARLTAAYAVGGFLLALGSVVALDLALAAGLERDLDRVAKDDVRELEAALGEPDFPRAIVETVRRHEGAAAPRVLLRVRAADGTLVAGSAGMAEELPAHGPPVLADAHGSEVGASGEWWEVRRRAARRGEESFSLEVALERRELDRLLAKYRAGAAGVLGAALLLSAGFAYLLARRGVRPIEQVTDAARRVSSLTLGAERLDVGGAPAEIADLAATFNAMLDRLDDAFRRLKEVGADLAHELRTPVHNLRGEAEVALLKERSPAEYREALAGVLEDCARLSRVIDDILLIERTEGRADALERESFDLADEVDDLASWFEAKAAGRGVAIDVRAERPLAIDADRLKLRRALANLIDNAIQYTPAGGRVTVTARAAAEEAVEVAVEDTGIGIAPADLARCFERFFRVDRSRARGEAGGVGLGLAIVRTLVRAHGGEVALASEPGRGTRALVRLPRRPPPPPS